MTKIPSQNKEDVLDLALTPLEKTWLAFEIGALKAQYTRDGRDVLRSMWAVCDRLGVTKEDWQRLETAVLQDDSASGIPSNVCFRRFMIGLTGVNPEI